MVVKICKNYENLREKFLIEQIFYNVITFILALKYTFNEGYTFQEN